MTKPYIEITKITILQNFATDEILMETTLPSGIYPYNDNSYVKMQVTHNQGPNYCKIYFPEIIPEIINIR
jgi:hypothetical protein